MGVVATVAFSIRGELAGLDAGEAIRHLGISNEIASAHLDTVDTELPRGQLNEPLAEEGPFIPARGT